MKKALLYSLLCATIGLAAGCDRTVTIRGDLSDAEGWPIPGIVDVRGEGLPGVAVSVHGTSIQAVTNTLGQYRIRCAPGEIRLDLMKSGYTSGQLFFNVDSPRTVEATQAILWPLPPTWGAYLFEDFRYRECTRIEPRRYRREAGGPPFFGTKIRPAAYTTNTSPLIVTHRMPAYDLRLYRLEELTETLTHDDGSTYEDTIWAPAGALPVYPDAIDEPDRRLVEVRLQQDLELGTYAIHWGALDGYTTTSPFIFLFEVVDPESLEAEIEETEEESTPARPLSADQPNPSGAADF